MPLFHTQIFLISIATATVLALDCPPSHKLYPCSCGEYEGMPIVNCEGFNNLYELEPAVKNTIGYNVSFGFLRSQLIDIPSDFFKGHTSVVLRFEQCTIRTFGDRPFSGLEEHLKGLYIYQSIDKSITKLATLRFSHLKNLNYFSCAYNDFAELGNHWFESGPESLTNLDLDYNKIERLGEKAFASLVKLEQLYLIGNQIKEVTRSLLPLPLKSLWLIEAKSNLIEELPSNAFDGYPNLKTVNLESNKLKSIPENVWSEVWHHLDEVYIYGNDILCDGKLKWIYTHTLPTILDGKCGPGNYLQDRELKSLKLEDLQ